jgi:hypothetical protein
VLEGRLTLENAIVKARIADHELLVLATPAATAGSAELLASRAMTAALQQIKRRASPRRCRLRSATRRGTRRAPACSVPEIAWQNSDGTPGIWLMKGTTPIAEAGLPNPGPARQVLSVDHFTSDGLADFLTQSTSGPLGLWELNGTSIVAETGVPSAGSGWLVKNDQPLPMSPGH